MAPRRQADDEHAAGELMSSVALGQKKPPDLTTAARRTAVGLEDVIRHQKDETGALIAPDGSYVVQPRVGSSTHVSFSGAELSRVLTMTCTHNHPHGNGPSAADLALGAKYKLHEVRVVTPDFRFIVNGLASVPYRDIDFEYQDEERRMRQAVNALVRQGLLLPSDFQYELRHRTWRQVSLKLGFNYDRERS